MRPLEPPSSLAKRHILNQLAEIRDRAQLTKRDLPSPQQSPHEHLELPRRRRAAPSPSPAHPLPPPPPFLPPPPRPSPPSPPLPPWQPFDPPPPRCSPFRRRPPPPLTATQTTVRATRRSRQTMGRRAPARCSPALGGSTRRRRSRCSRSCSRSSARHPRRGSHPRPPQFRQ
eukprot:3635783-Pleurochrysis_carterae.AAC.1